MAKKKSSSFDLIKYLLIIPSLFNLASHLIALVKADVHIMKQKLIGVIVATIVFTTFFTTIWVSLMALLVLFLISQNISIALAITLVFILNFFLLLIAAFTINIIKRNMVFPETREAVKEIISQ